MVNSLIKIILTLFVISIFTKCLPDPRCKEPRDVDFRAFKFTFPVTAYELMHLTSNKMFWNRYYVRSDTTAGGPDIFCYTDRNRNKFTMSDSVNFLKQAEIYAVSFVLHKEYKESDEAILRELRKLYPGEYKHTRKYGHEYYWNHQDCMSIIYERDAWEEGGVPVVSFLYGLTEQEEQMYANDMGNIYHFD